MEVAQCRLIVENYESIPRRLLLFPLGCCVFEALLALQLDGQSRDWVSSLGGQHSVNQQVDLASDCVSRVVDVVVSLNKEEALLKHNVQGKILTLYL